MAQAPRDDDPDKPGPEYQYMESDVPKQPTQSIVLAADRNWCANKDATEPEKPLGDETMHGSYLQLQSDSMDCPQCSYPNYPNSPYDLQYYCQNEGCNATWEAHDKRIDPRGNPGNSKRRFREH